MSHAVLKNGAGEVHCDKPDNALAANSQEKLRLIMVSMASRAHSCCWKMLDDTEDSLPALLNISLDDAKSVYHSCGICDENAGNLLKKELDKFTLTMDGSVMEIADHKKQKFLRPGGLKLKDSIIVPKLQCQKGKLMPLNRAQRGTQRSPWNSGTRGA